jgi:hypothetical protein
MSLKTRLTSVGIHGHPRPLFGLSCQCLAEFYREEFRKHHECLVRQREYYSELAMSQAEDALARILAELDQLCQRDDACRVVGELLRQFDMVTKLSAWTDAKQIN